MIDVVALTAGANTPSARFRVRQHVDPLAGHGVAVREYVPAIDTYAAVPGWPKRWRQRYSLPLYLPWQGVKLSTRLPGIYNSWTADVTWLQRPMLPGWLSLEPLLGRPLVFDVDDAVWLNPPLGRLVASRMAAIADVVVVGNAHLADWFDAPGRRVEIVPTAVDSTRFAPGPDRAGDAFVVGWTGSASTLPYLEGIEPEIAPFFARHDEARIRVVADRAPRFTQISGRQVDFVAWEPAVEATALQPLDVGLMPLPDTRWTRGKCSFKMLQYLSTGVPAIVSPVGLNADILDMAEVGVGVTDGGWDEALEQFYRDRAWAEKLGAAGRQLVEERFSTRVVSDSLAAIFASLT